MFTGKNKEQFEKWLPNYKLDLRLEGEVSYVDFTTHINPYYKHYFYQLPFSMQQGVYLEYLDSVNVIIENDYYLPNDLEGGLYNYDVYTFNNYYSVCSYGTRQEEIKEAFKKEDELINKI